MRLLITPPPVPYPPRYIVDPVAFFAALIAGPLLFTAASFWAFLIPVFALFFGGPLYLIIGTPVLLWYLRRNDGDPSDLAFLAFIVLLVISALIILAAAVLRDGDFVSLAVFIGGFGMIFAPAWAYFFGRLYQFYRRDFFAEPRPF